MDSVLYPPEHAAELQALADEIAYISKELENPGGSDVYAELIAERKRLINEWNRIQGFPEPYDDEEGEG